MATKTGNSYTTGTKTDRMTIPTANLGFSTTLSARKLTPTTATRTDKDRQPEMAIQTFWVPSLQLLVVDRCRNHLANPLSSSSSSKITNLALEFRRYLSEFQRCNYFRFGGHIDINRSCILTCQHYFPHIHGLKPQICRWHFKCISHSFRFQPPFPIVGHYWNRLGTCTLPASWPWSNAVGSPLEFWWYMSQFRRYYYFR